MTHLATAYLSHRKGGVAVALIGLFLFANGLGAMWGARLNAKNPARPLYVGPGKHWREMLAVGGLAMAAGIVFVLAT